MFRKISTPCFSPTGTSMQQERENMSWKKQGYGETLEQDIVWKFIESKGRD